MKYFNLFLVSLVLFSCDKKEETGTETVIYQVTFQGNWNSINHPNNFPANDHFSPLLGVIHSENVSIYEEGSLASDGIEQMAESGSNDLLLTEINTLGAEVFRTIDMGGFSSGNESRSYQFDASDYHTRLTLTSMIAPSPDWFIGIQIDLKPNGEWIEEITVPFEAYDAGTEEGTTYSYDYNDEMPPKNISLLDVETIKKEGDIIPFAFLKLKKFVVYRN